jgi:hypothetical protein
MIPGIERPLAVLALSAGWLTVSAAEPTFTIPGEKAVRGLMSVHTDEPLPQEVPTS